MKAKRCSHWWWSVWPYCGSGGPESGGVSIFEASGRLGGRLFSMDVLGHAVDVGATVMVPYRFAIERADPAGVCCPWLEGVPPLPFCSGFSGPF